MKETPVKKAIANQKLAAKRALQEGTAYEPFVRADRFSSRGTARRVYLHKTRRVHHLLSEGEYRAFLKFGFTKEVIDIREQYPLPVTATLQSANQLGIVHPCTTRGRIALVMTVDLMLTMNDGSNVAYDFKPSDKLNNPRTIAKLEIVRSACKNFGIEHHLITEESLPLEECRNLERLLDGQPRPGEEHNEATWDADVMSRIVKVSKSDEPLWVVCKKIDDDLEIEVGSSLKALHRLAYRQKIQLSLSQRNLTLLPIKKALTIPQDM